MSYSAVITFYGISFSFCLNMFLHRNEFLIALPNNQNSMHVLKSP